MKGQCILLFIACSAMFAESMWMGRPVYHVGKRNEVDLAVDPAAPPPDRATIDVALKNADEIIQDAIAKAEDPNSSISEENGKVEIPVGLTEVPGTDYGEMHDRLRDKTESLECTISELWHWKTKGIVNFSTEKAAKPKRRGVVRVTIGKK